MECISFIPAIKITTNNNNHNEFSQSFENLKLEAKGLAGPHSLQSFSGGCFCAMSGLSSPKHSLTYSLDTLVSASVSSPCLCLPLPVLSPCVYFTKTLIVVD